MRIYSKNYLVYACDICKMEFSSLESCTLHEKAHAEEAERVKKYLDKVLAKTLEMAESDKNLLPLVKMGFNDVVVELLESRINEDEGDDINYRERDAIVELVMKSLKSKAEEEENESQS